MYAGISSAREPSGLFYNFPKNIRPDLQLFNPAFNAVSELPNDSTKDLLLDLTIICSSSSGRMDGSQSSMNAAYNEKNRKFKTASETNGYLFLPLVFDTFGQWHPVVVDIVRNTCAIASTLHQIPFSVLVDYWSTRISSVLHKGNADLLYRRALGLRVEACAIGGSVNDLFIDPTSVYCSISARTPHSATN